MPKPMIERMARALCSHAGNPENTKFEGKPMWQNYLPEARAVLSAMREPDEAMLLAGTSALPGHPSGSEAANRIVREIHTAMIDEARASAARG